jgi:hypothetical protein
MTAIDVELQACDRGANRFRSWRVEVGKDLFGCWNARVSFGRVGCEGRTRRHDFRTKGKVGRFLRRCLRRRAPPKIGSPFATGSSTLHQARCRCCGSSGWRRTDAEGVPERRGRG